MQALTLARFYLVRWGGGLGHIARYRHDGGAKCRQWTDGAALRLKRKRKARAAKAAKKSSVTDLLAAFRA